MKALTIFTALLLSACTFAPEQVKVEQKPTETQSGAVRVEGSALQEETKEEEGVEVEEQTERLLPSGVLEIGNRNAPITLLIFLEHHVEYAREFFFSHTPLLTEKFIEPGHLKLQIAMLPLEKYRNSKDAQAAFFCSARQGKAMEMHEKLFLPGNKHFMSLTPHVRALNLDEQRYELCRESEELKDWFALQGSLARTLDVTLVPTLFLNGERQVGLPYEADLVGDIEAILTKD